MAPTFPKAKLTIPHSNCPQSQLIAATDVGLLKLSYLSNMLNISYNGMRENKEKPPIHVSSHLIFHDMT